MKSSEATTDSFHKVFMESDIARACKKIPMPEGSQGNNRARTRAVIPHRNNRDNRQYQYPRFCFKYMDKLFVLEGLGDF